MKINLNYGFYDDDLNIPVLELYYAFYFLNNVFFRDFLFLDVVINF